MIAGLGSPDFNEFVRNVARHRPGFVAELYGWYATPEIDFVGRQENLAADLVLALRRMGLDLDEERVRSRPAENASRCDPLQWDPGLREEIERLEYAALVRYGYTEPSAESGLGGHGVHGALSPTPVRELGPRFAGRPGSGVRPGGA
jgi:hypothetical protein